MQLKSLFARKNTNIFFYYLSSLLKLSNSLLTHNSLLSLWVKINANFRLLNTYYLRTEHLWLDGFLFDFLQKKTADIWIRKFVIYTGFIFSERLVFDVIVKLYMDYFVWYMHKFSIFEVSNVFEMLNTVLYALVTIFFILITIILIF
jgi:hypothetical protein